jgi:hypothetical protein
MIWPLSLAPFERYMLADDGPGHPMQFFCRLRFSGRLERAPLEKALQIALARHTLLRAVVRQSGRFCMHWVAAEKSLPTLHWINQEPTETLPPASYLDIRAAPGVVMTAVVGESKSDLVGQFHHAACDALGSFDFLGDLLTTYGDVVAGGKRFRLKPLDPERLRQRASFGLTVGKRIKRAPGDLAALFRAKRFYKRRPAPLMPSMKAGAKPLPGAYPQGKFHRFGREETAALSRMATAFGASVNSLLVRDLFLAVSEWRTRQNVACRGDWLRIVVPTNMREVGDRRMPAANLVSLVFLDRQMSALEDPDALLATIVDEMQAVKRDALGMRFVLVLGLMQSFPRFLARGLGRRRGWATVLLTNVGPVLHNCHLPRADARLLVGGLTLEEFDFLPVIRRLEPVSFAVSTYAGKLTLGMHFDPRTVIAANASATLDLYVRRIRESISRSIL